MCKKGESNLTWFYYQLDKKMGFIFDLLFVSLLDLYMKNATNATLNRHFKSEILRKKKLKLTLPPGPPSLKG